MAVALLDPAQVARLRGQDVTYSSDEGCRRLERTRRLPDGTDFERTARDLFAWQVQARAGLQIAASSVQVARGVVVVLGVGVGRLAITAPCVVVDVVVEADRRGFSYGTLPGHPESGQESFVLRRTDDEGVDFTVSAFSRPASRLARLGGPAGRAVQDVITRRYLRALG